MATVILCDICTEPSGIHRMRVRVAGEIYPSNGDPIHQGKEIDVCQVCLRSITDLTTSYTLEILQRTERCRRALANTEH
jgi:hypothetical protein